MLDLLDSPDIKSWYLYNPFHRDFSYFDFRNLSNNFLNLWNLHNPINCLHFWNLYNSFFPNNIRFRDFPYYFLILYFRNLSDYFLYLWDFDDSIHSLNLWYLHNLFLPNSFDLGDLWDTKRMDQS
eukprot:Filipodium_phascolosomae@DN2493_c0_g1_i10.p1